MPAFDAADEDPRLLAEALDALGNPVRIALLKGIRSPKPLKDIQVRAISKAARPDPSDRYISRQAVKEHLERLVEVGVVLAQEVKREYGETRQYVVNHQALFALAEKFRDLARLRPETELGLATIHAQRPGAHARRRGAGLLLVKGLEEGRFFPLEPSAPGRGKWVIGRRRGLPVTLDFDPFASSENTAILLEAEVHRIEDLPHSRNGTTLNFLPLEKGKPSPLTAGDVIGVGRSLLVFRP